MYSSLFIFIYIIGEVSAALALYRRRAKKRLALSFNKIGGASAIKKSQLFLLHLHYL